MRPTYYHAVPGSLSMQAPETDTTQQAEERPSALQEAAEGWGAYIFPSEARARQWARKHAPESRTVEVHKLRLKRGTRTCEPTSSAADLSAMAKVLGPDGALTFATDMDEATMKRLSIGLTRLGYGALLGPHYGIVFSPDAFESLGSTVRRQA